MKFKWPIIVFVISGIFLGIVLIRGVETFDDTSIYLSAIQQIEHKTPIYQEKQYIAQVIPLLTNPATIILSVVIGGIFNSELTGLAIINIIFYILTAFVFYNLALLILKNNRDAIIALIFLAGSYSILRFGPGAYLVDMPGWFFYILALFLSIRFFYSQEEKFAYLAGFTSMIGLFFKEYGGIGILTLVVLIFLSPLALRKKFALAIKSCSFLFVNLGYHIWAYISHGYLYFHRYGTILKNFAPHQTVFRTIKVLGYLFHIGWPIALVGLWEGLSKKFENIQDHKKIFLGILPSAVVFLAYPAYDQRIAFIGVPLLSLLAAMGLKKISSRAIIYLIMTFYVIVSFFLLHKLSLPT
jgi:hypothetical protein